MITRYRYHKARNKGWDQCNKRWMALPCALIMVFLVAPSYATGTNRTPLGPPVGDVLLIVAGAVESANHDGEAHFDAAMLDQFTVHETTTSTSVTDGVSVFKGPLVRDILQRVGAQGTTVQARALNNYEVDIPLSDFYEFDVLLAMYQDGKRLELSDKGPFWIVYPRDQFSRLQDMRYDYRWVWQLHRLTVQ